MKSQIRLQYAKNYPGYSQKLADDQNKIDQLGFTILDYGLITIMYITEKMNE